MDPYYAPAYGNRAILYYQRGEFEKALDDLNEALRLDTRESGYYINRGLVRYQLNDLRGAMADYDQVISIDSHNLIARFNRGLLRFQVGDNNRAIEDFDVVIEMEPDNYMAYYNRALLRFETGDYRGAVEDYDVVLKEYPTFLPGFIARSEAKRKMGDEAGADRDYWAAIRMEEQARKGQLPKKGTSGGATQTASADDGENTREESDKNIEKFNRLVVYDKEEERKSKYQSEVRGRVQDRNVRVELEPQFVLTYYVKPDPVKKLIYYDKQLEDFNARMVLKRKLILTNEEAALIEEQISRHFLSIDDYSAQLAADPKNVYAYFGRGMDFMLVQDFAEAISDFSSAIDLDPTFVMAYFNRAVVRYKQMIYDESQQAKSDNFDLSGSIMNLNSTPGQISGSLPSTSDPSSARLKDNKRAYEHEQIVRDYDMVIKLSPDFVYAYFNRGGL